MVRLGWKAARSRAFRDSDDFMDELIGTMTSLGGIYAKFLQGILLGYAVGKRRTVDARQLDVFEDNPNPHFTLHEIHSALGRASHSVIVTDTTPIGVGSYSAVYDGTLHDGTEVVVKILRPNIKDEIYFDLKFLKRLTYILQLAEIKVIGTDLKQFYASFKKACIKETDFSSEIEFADEMYERYKSHPTIVVPRTYTDYCNARVIVQQKIHGISAKTLIESRVSDGENIIKLTKDYYNTDLVAVLRRLTYEKFYSLLSGKSFHGDLHPGNVRILPDNKVGMLDFGIRADGYTDSVVPAAVNKFMSDLQFVHGDFDLVRILDAHFRLYMAQFYASVESLLRYYRRDVKDFFHALVSAMGVSTEQATDAKRAEWLRNGPAMMLNDILKGSEKYGIEVKVRDHSTSRGISTHYALLKALGMKGTDVLGPVYEQVCPQIMRERGELFAAKKTILPDLALENVYGWLEKLNHTNPELAHKLRTLLESDQVAPEQAA